MLHHHPVHLPSNQQLRDSTRLGQPVSMPMHHQRLMNLPPPQANPGCFEPKPLFCQYRFRKLSRPKESMKCTGLVRCPGVLMTMPPPPASLAAAPHVPAVVPKLPQTGLVRCPGVLMTMPPPPASLAAASHVPTVVPKLPQTGMSGCGENDSQRPGPQTQPQPPPLVQNGGGNQASTAAAAAAANAAAAAAASNHLANTKEKTPMCLVNELARFNKIQHQYRLTNEQGPAHKKVFTVTLKLGDEEYASDGASIKKAQHSAANEALQHTQYKHPPPKTARNVRLGKSNVTPTVELNALAMKRGEPAIYTFLETTPPIAPPAQPPPSSAPGPPYLQQTPQPSHHGFNYRPGQQMYHHQRFHYKTGPGSAPSGAYQPTMFHVCLRVGSREFIGEGPTAQAAKHDAAGKAVSQLKQLPLPDEQPIHRQIDENEIIETPTDPNTELKSPISLVHEIALKRSYNVTFDVVSEKGPPHMRTFVTKCAVGDKIATGEGNGKKISKKRAAEKMLDELRNLPPPSPTLVASRIKRKSNPGKKKSRNLIKVYHQEQKTESDYGNISANAGPVNNGGGVGGNNGTEDVNPISRLIQIQQAKKEKEPIYTLVEERGVPRRREFVMEVKVGQHASTGCGPNKKLAKRAAAEALLTHLGYSRPTSTPTCPPAPGKSAIKVPSDHSSSSINVEKARKVMFLDETTDKGSVGSGMTGGGSGGSDMNSTVAASVASVTPSAGGPSGRQLVPGLLLMADTAQVSGYAATPSKSSGVNLQTTATIAKELLKAGNSPTAEALAKGSPGSGPGPGIPVISSLAALGLASPAAAAAPVSAAQITSPIIKPKEQLLYLAQLLGFQVQFSDFPKGNHSEYLSLVSLSTDPPHVCHGAGSTTEASHDQAALTALRALAEIGLDAVAPPGGSIPQTNGQQETGVDPTGYTQ